MLKIEPHEGSGRCAVIEMAMPQRSAQQLTTSLCVPLDLTPIKYTWPTYPCLPATRDRWPSCLRAPVKTPEQSTRGVCCVCGARSGA